MTPCLFTSDLHGHIERYQKLIDRIAGERPKAIFLGGDLLPSAWSSRTHSSDPKGNFVDGFLIPEFKNLKNDMGDSYPRIFLILGNDDMASEEEKFIKGATLGLWIYVNLQKHQFGPFSVYGYAFVPPTPFQLKDWEKYDVSRYVDPHCIPPEEGWRSVHVPKHEILHTTIRGDLKKLVKDDDLTDAILLFHTPPYKTNLDRAALDDLFYEHVPLDVHVGSIAVRELIESRQPLITLHGHIHESARISGNWRDRIGHTHMFSGAHHGPELALIHFDPKKPASAVRELI